VDDTALKCLCKCGCWRQSELDNIISSVDSATFRSPGIAIKEGLETTSDTMPTMNTRDLFSPNQSPLTASALDENSTKRSQSPSIAMRTQDLISTIDQKNDTIAWSQGSPDNIQVETSADSGNQTINSSQQPSSGSDALPADATPTSPNEADMTPAAELPAARTPQKRIRPLEIVSVD
jgi:hypothetical protein